MQNDNENYNLKQTDIQQKLQKLTEEIYLVENERN